MTLREWAFNLRKDYENSSQTIQDADLIVSKIVNGKFSNGTPFSSNDMDIILGAFEADSYDRRNDSYVQFESSSQAHMKLLNYIKNKEKGK